jgi:hypothetical protein
MADALFVLLRKQANAMLKRLLFVREQTIAGALRDDRSTRQVSCT